MTLFLNHCLKCQKRYQFLHFIILLVIRDTGLDYLPQISPINCSVFTLVLTFIQFAIAAGN